MTQFNQELITKARKGEIAILNDGSVEELKSVLKEAWPTDDFNIQGAAKYYFKDFNDPLCWWNDDETALPSHSVKDFFMTNKLNISPQKKFSDIVDAEAKNVKAYVDQPRTYKVTRQQMKEIWEVAPCQGAKNKIVEMTTAVFDPFGIEAELNKTEVSMIVDQFDEPLPDLLKLVFTPYFHIPEGEPVLCKRYNDDEWRIRVSDGKGGAYDNGLLSGEVKYFRRIIPFTKNPPK